MPHVIVELCARKIRTQKQQLADAITKNVMTFFTMEKNPFP